MTTPPEILALLEEAANARAATLAAQLDHEATGKRYREAMSKQATATKALSDARAAWGRGKPLNV